MGSFKFKLVVYFLVLSLLPMAAAFWGFNAVAKRGETRRVDARLEGGLAAALAAYQDELEAAERAASALAKNRGFQYALAVRDRAALQRIVRNSPNLRIEAGDFRVGRVDPLAAERQVAVLVSGDLLGEVVASVPLDSNFLRRLRARSGLSPGDEIAILGDGTVVVGPKRLMGRVTAPPGRTTTAMLGGVRYRVLVADLVDELGASLAVLSPQARIDRANEASERRLFFGLLTALILIALVAYIEGRSIVRTLGKLVEAANAIARGRLDERVPVRGRDEFALLGRTFNEMADQLEARLAELEAGRRRLREATARFGEALAATHDVEQLLRVIVETAVESTGAAGGVRLAERIRRSLESRIVLTPDGMPIPITASFGVASFPEAATESELTAAADAALYEAKRAGKNRVVASAEPVRRS